MVVKVTCKTNYLFSERKINRDITGNEKKKLAVSISKRVHENRGCL